jgi:hypothetical protein
MTAPLANLRRTAVNVQMHDSFELARSADALQNEERMVFLSVDNAEAYLRFWAGESGAMVVLRRTLERRAPGVTPYGFSDQRVLHALAQLMVSGALVVFERRIDVPRAAGESSVTAAATTAAPAAASIPVSPVTPPVVPAVPVLDALDDVQIEGAQVLPEVLQTIEQIDLTMAQLSLATASLAPTPSGVPAIGTAISGASGSITSTLGDL